MVNDPDGSCLARVRSAIQNESGVIAKIGRMVVREPRRARSMSIGKLAEACGVSAATVYRFCRRLGYEGFKEFQLDLATATALTNGIGLDDFIGGDSPNAIIRRVFEFNRQSLADTERILDHRVLIHVAKLIQRSRKVLLLGLGDSALTARRAADCLLSLGLTAVAATDPYTQIFATENVGHGDVVVGISHTGRTIDIIEAIHAAREKGARTVALTNYPHSPLAGASEFQLVTAFREYRVNVAVSSVIIPQLCVVAALYFILGSWGGRKAERLAKRVEQRTRITLRVRSNTRTGT
ncbi:MAG: MurR/RpiR family transcriptional regulator [Acidobacteriia bacterium]|nr:MurR/RpiR family transcriptional regulator [Terriglobia bacterium]